MASAVATVAPLRQRLTEHLSRGVAAAQEAGRLPAVALPDFTVEQPQRSEHGDYATNLAMRLARTARMAPRQIATAIVESLPPDDMIATAEIAGAGFINFRLGPTWLAAQTAAIVKAGTRFGCTDARAGQRIQVEFVSANPVGPLHVGSGRAAALGDALANLLATVGADVRREYYVNDAGSRMEAFGQSIYARYVQHFGGDAEVPADGYHGTYVRDEAAMLADELGDAWVSRNADDAAAELGRLAMARMSASHHADMDALGVRFDEWFREQALFDRGEVASTLELLRSRGYVTEREGAVWFRSSALGDEKDNVLIRSTGVPGYLVSDIAYHRDKFFTRNLDTVIDIWGADHQGHVPRMRAAVEALGLEPSRLVIIVHQMVTLKRGDEVVRLSKRTGDIILLSEVVQEVGADACRYFFLSRSPDSHMDFDLDLAAQQSAENPVYYIQYSHARLAGIRRHAEQLGFSESGADLEPLTSEPERQLMRWFWRYPEVVEDAARQLQPHHLAHFALEFARQFHTFYEQCRVVDESEPELTRARLVLVEATRIVLANTLAIMGIAAPEHMSRDDDPSAAE
ncbi:MAG: arginine--tRNA ligase [Dehalococcoidia bacterium]|nr:arginine--tRNA ligase [Dehalococcoidia bacterium]